jgi:hypothetical protein
MQIDITQAMKFLRPAAEALVTSMLTGGTVTPMQTMLGQVILSLLSKYQTPGGQLLYQAHVGGGDLDLPPEHEWTPAGIERYYRAKAEAQAGPDDAA